MVFITEILNPFEPNDKNTTIYAPGKKLKEYIDTSRYIAFSGDRLLEDENEVIGKNTQITIIPIVERGEDSKGVLRAATMVALAVAAPALVPAGLSTFAASAFKFAIVAGGAMLINQVLPPQTASFASDSSSIDTSNTYGWGSLKTLPRPGAPIPVLYGQMMLSGSVIGQYISNEGDDEYYHVLLALCEGEIEPISIDDIYINNSPASSYDGVEFAYRTGTIDQDISAYPITRFEKFHTEKTIGWFGNVTTANVFSAELPYNTGVERQTLGNSSTEIVLNISCPKGLFSINSSGGIDREIVNFRVEYSTDGVNWTTYTHTPETYDVLEYEWEVFSFEGLYYNLVWAATQPPDYYNGYRYVPYKKTGRKRIRAIPGTPIDFFQITAGIVASIRRQFKLEGLQPNQYTIRVTKIDVDYDTTSRQNTLYWDGMTEVINERLYYPGIALLGLRLKATGQLSDSADVKVLVRRKDIDVYRPDGTLYKTMPSDLPAAVFWDILTNRRYGYGLSYDQVDFSKVEEFDNWTTQPAPTGDGGDEPRARFNAVFDYDSNIWDTLQKITSVGRAAPIIFGTKYSLIIDKPQDPVQLFTMGNIVKDSFKIEYIGKNDIANEIDIDFKDRSIDYENNTITVQLGDGGNKTSIGAIGTVTQSQAFRNGRYLLQVNDKQRRVVSFEAKIDSIACKAGDVIYFAHDVPQWGYSGRIVSATTDTVTLDRKIYIDGALTYRIIVRLSDDTIETKEIVNQGTGQYDTFSVTPAFTSIPKEFDAYTMGEVGKEYLPLRITSITRASDHTRKITATDYNASILDDWSTPEPIKRPSAITGFPKILDINIGEHLERRKDGTIVPYIDFTWRTENSMGTTVTLLVSGDNGDTWDEVQTGIRATNYRMSAIELTEGKTYIFALVSGQQPISEAAKVYHTYYGKSAPPNNVQNFRYSITSNGLLLEWDKNTDVDLSGYNIYLDGSRIETDLKASTYSYSDITIGLHKFEIEAVDTSGNVSLQKTPLSVDMQAAEITSIRAEVIDNNVLLYWESQKGTVDIANYIVKKDGAIVGTKKGTFTTILETKAGQYTYCVTPVDIFGNDGIGKCATTDVAAPPDYVLNANWESSFLGTKTNVTIYRGSLLLPVNTSETWEGHFINNSWNSPNDQVLAGYPIYIEPFSNTTTYEEIFDYGGILASSKISVNITKDIIQGTVTEQCDIHISTDGANWTTYTDTYTVYATNFRYVKIVLTYTGANSAISITKIDVKLDSKTISDEGMATCNASDATGTRVYFNKAFIDIDAINVTPIGTSIISPVVDFNDAPNPTYFDVYLFDESGNRVTADIFWTARGK